MKFRAKYRIESSRLSGWDYAQDGFYFITICSQQKENLFGEIVKNEMILNKTGEIVAAEWAQTEQIRANVRLDEFIVMPNHLHGIIEIDNSRVVETPRSVETLPRSVETLPRSVETLPRSVETLRATSLQSQNANQFSKISPKSNSLSAIIRGFKSAATKRIHEIHPALDRIWQARFYDHIIRGEDELNRIRDYIRLNPQNWEKDKLRAN